MNCTPRDKRFEEKSSRDGPPTQHCCQYFTTHKNGNIWEITIHGKFVPKSQNLEARFAEIYKKNVMSKKVLLLLFKHTFTRFALAPTILRGQNLFCPTFSCCFFIISSFDEEPLFYFLRWITKRFLLGQVTAGLEIFLDIFFFSSPLSFLSSSLLINGKNGKDMFSFVTFKLKK